MVVQGVGGSGFTGWGCCGSWLRVYDSWVVAGLRVGVAVGRGSGFLICGSRLRVRGLPFWIYVRVHFGVLVLNMSGVGLRAACVRVSNQWDTHGINIRIRISTHMHACMHAYIHTCTHACLHIRISGDVYHDKDC